MRRIFYLVLGVHLLLIGVMALQMPNQKQKKKPLQVRMAPPPLSLPKKEAVAVVAHAPLTKESPKLQNKKKEEGKKEKPLSKTHTLEKKTKAKPKNLVVPENLVKKLEESIAKIEQKQDKEMAQPKISAPKWISTLKIDQEEQGSPGGFVESLILCLQNTLDLPEIGSVKIALTVKCSGGFVKMEVLESESQRNAQFLETELRRIQYPSFSGELKQEKEHTFVITFCNT